MTTNVKPGASGGAADGASGSGEGQGAGGEGEKKTQAAGQAEGESDEGDGDGGDTEDDAGWDDKTKAYIQKLRKEAADNRTKAKDLRSKLTTEQATKKAMLKAAGFEDDSEDPATKLQQTQETANSLLFRNAILESAVQHGISGDGIEFFQFLVQKEAEALQEGDELSEDQLAAIVAKVKKTGAGTGAGNTSVGTGKGKGGANPPSPEAAKGVTLDQFCKMNMSQKSELYSKNPELYNSLVADARQNNRLV